jgi:dolichyl-phosphate beta-glucosyltransferase
MKQPFLRRAAGTVFRWVVYTLVFPGIRDTQCGFKLFRKDAADAIFSKQRIEGFSFDVEALFLARRLGFQIAEVPVEWADDPQSKVHPVRDAYRMFRDILKIRWNALLGRYK